MRLKLTLSLSAMLASAALTIATPIAWAQHGEPAAPQAETKSLQGGDNSAWTNNPHMHDFYDLTVAMLGKGAAKLDFAAYREKSYAIFRVFGVSMGATAEGMVEHLKDIPHQLVGIVKDDPEVLDSYAKFTLALMGPQ